MKAEQILERMMRDEQKNKMLSQTEALKVYPELSLTLIKRIPFIKKNYCAYRASGFVKLYNSKEIENFIYNNKELIEKSRKRRRA